jgi:hypothetical protein
MTTCAWIFPETGPGPYVAAMASAARSVTACSPSGARFSISLRNGVP